MEVIISFLSDPDLVSSGIMMARFKHRGITDSAIHPLIMTIISGRS